LEKKKNFFNHILETRKAEMTRKEKAVAGYIVSHQAEVVYMRVTDLEKETGVSEATIIRTSRKMGFKGFQHLKIELAKEMAEPLKKINEKLSFSDTSETVLDKTISSIIEALESTRKVLDIQALENAANAILKTRRLLLFGLGNSASIAMDAQHKLLRAGVNAMGISDNHMQIIASSSLKSGDAVIGISHSGRSKDIVEVMRFAKTRGAITICITNYASSPITKTDVSSIVLFTKAEETKFRIVGMSSRIAQLMILDTLFTIISLKKGPLAIENYERLEKALSSKKYTNNSD